MTLNPLIALILTLGIGFQEPAQEPKHPATKGEAASQSEPQPESDASKKLKELTPDSILKAVQDAADALSQKHDGHEDDHGDEVEVPEIGRKMRKVQEILAKADQSLSPTPLQQEIADDLKKLIDQISSGDRCPECGKQNCTEHGQKRNTSNQQQQAKQQQQQQQQAQQQQSQSNQSQPAQPGQSATSQASADGSNIRMIKAVWGHLPAKLREEMQQSFRESPLPQYEQRIERYFQTIAEQNNR